MGIYADDGYATYTGALGSVTNLVNTDNGGCCADSIFLFNVQTAGTYPFRTIWENGGGGSNIEWWTIKADGTKVLINDSANGGDKAYQVATAAPATGGNFTSITRSGNNVTMSWTGTGVTLQSATTVTGAWTAVPSATSPYTAPITGTQGYYRLH